MSQRQQYQGNHDHQGSKRHPGACKVFIVISRHKGSVIFYREGGPEN